MPAVKNIPLWNDSESNAPAASAKQESAKFVLESFFVLLLMKIHIHSKYADSQ